MPVTHYNSWDYYGNFINGLKDGYRIVRLPSGEFKQGDFQNDLMNGSGRWISADGNNIYVGNFCNDQFSGHGVLLEQHTGNVYDGERHNSLRHGHGRYYWRDGHMYDGQWANDHQHGEGTMYNADATVRQRGTWEKGNFIG